MESGLIIMAAAFVGVLALVFGVYSAFQGNSDSTVEARLAAFTGGAQPSKKDITEQLMRDGMNSAGGIVGGLTKRFVSLPMFFRQANSPIADRTFPVPLCRSGGTGSC